MLWNLLFTSCRDLMHARARDLLWECRVQLSVIVKWCWVNNVKTSCLVINTKIDLIQRTELTLCSVSNLIICELHVTIWRDTLTLNNFFYSICCEVLLFRNILPPYKTGEKIMKKNKCTNTQTRVMTLNTLDLHEGKHLHAPWMYTLAFIVKQEITYQMRMSGGRWEDVSV